MAPRQFRWLSTSSFHQLDDRLLHVEIVSRSRTDDKPIAIGQRGILTTLFHFHFREASLSRYIMLLKLCRYAESFRICRATRLDEGSR